MQEILDKLSGIGDALRQNVTDAQWAKIPLTITETLRNPAAAAGVPITPPIQVSGLVLITQVVTSVPTGATGVLRIGSYSLAVPAGVTSFACQVLAFASDVRSLTLVGGGGDAAIWIMGEQLPTAGALAD